MSKGDSSRTSDHEAYDAGYEKIFGSEEEVRERRRKWIEEKKREKEEGDIKMVDCDPHPISIPALMRAFPQRLRRSED